LLVRPLFVSAFKAYLNHQFYFALLSTAASLPNMGNPWEKFATVDLSAGVAGSAIPTTITFFWRTGLGWRALYSTEQDVAETIAITTIAPILIFENFFIFIFFRFLTKLHPLALALGYKFKFAIRVPE